MPWSKKELVYWALLIGLTTTLLSRVVPYLEIHDVQLGDRAPDFDLTAEDGSGIRLQDYRGKLVLLNFWATWCPPCVDEMPSLNLVYEHLREKGLVVLGVSVDEEEAAYRDFLQSARVRFPTVRDPERTVPARYGTVKYPETYLIDREGYVLRKYVGAENWMRPEIMNYLSSLL